MHCLSDLMIQKPYMVRYLPMQHVSRRSRLLSWRRIAVERGILSGYLMQRRPTCHRMMLQVM